MQINLSLPATLTARYVIGRWDNDLRRPSRGTIEVSFGSYLLETLIPTASEDAACLEEMSAERQDEVESIVSAWLKEKLSLDGMGTLPCSECYALVPYERMTEHYRSVHP